MHKQIEGVYRNGKVELLGQHHLPENARVTVTFENQDAVTEEERQAAIANLIAMMNKGFSLGAPYPTREEIYDRDRRDDDTDAD